MDVPLHIGRALVDPRTGGIVVLKEKLTISKLKITKRKEKYLLDAILVSVERRR